MHWKGKYQDVPDDVEGASTHVEGGLVEASACLSRVPEVAHRGALEDEGEDERGVCCNDEGSDDEDQAPELPVFVEYSPV